MIKYPRSVHDSRIFNYSFNKIDNTTVRKDTDPIPVFLFGDSTYPLLPFIMTEFSGGSNIQEKRSSAINGLARITIKNSFGTLKACFRCLQCAMNMNINTLS